MPDETFAPDEQTLRRFLLGLLTGPEATRVEQYIDTHPEAAATLQSLSGDDTLTAALRDQPPAAEPDAEVETAILRLERLAGPDADQTTAAVSAGESLAGPPVGEETEDGLGFLAPAQQPGELGRLGGYRILKVLGAGGMGMVLEADDPRLGRHVAIKVMRPGIAANPKAVRRFLQEAKAAAAVEHDHIVPVYFIGEDNGVPYIVMPFLKGEPLDARLKREGRLPAAEITRIGLEAAEGLAAAHASGLIHRDIKPANLWLEAPRGRVKILDFGLARLAGQEGQLTQSGAIVGTPAYMAPEQARGQGVDARSDLFSLGGVLYRAATGRNPFGGTDTMSMLMSLATDTPADPRSLNPQLPPHLASVILRLLDKDPAKRPQSARELIGLLAPPTVEAMPGEPASAFAFDPDDRTEVERATPQAAPRRSKRGLLVGVVAAVLLLVGGGLAAYKLVIETKDGTLLVDVDGDADVRFRDGKLLIHDEAGKLRYELTPSEKNKTLPPGKYVVQVVGADGLTVDTHEFNLDRRGKAKIRVIVDQSWRPGAAAKKDPPGPGPKAAPPAEPRFALKFDGPDNYIPDNAVDIQFDRPWTIEAWVRPADVELQPGKGEGILGGQWFALNIIMTDGQGPRWSANGVAVDGPEVLDLHLSDTPVLPNVWTHLAAVYDGKAIRLYVQGVQQNNANRVRFPDRKMPIGTAPTEWLATGGRPGFHGLLREVRVSKTARYADSFKPAERFEPDDQTICLHHFDEGQGEVIRDASGHWPAARIVGARWVNLDGTPVDADRTVAAWVLARGDKSDVGVANSDGLRILSAAARAVPPAGPFQVVTTKLAGPVTPADFARLRDLSALNTVVLEQTGVTAAGLEHLAAVRSLQKLYLLNEAEVTDRAVRALRDCPGLTVLHLNDTALTNAGLEHLRGLKALTELKAYKTKVTAEGAAKLAAALPNCRIEFDGGTIEPKPPAGGAALKFGPADARVELPAIPALNTSRFCIEADVTPLDFGPLTGHGTILRADSCLVGISGGDGWGFALMGDGNPGAGGEVVQQGRRVHVAAVRDGNTIAIYTDGRKTGQYTIPGGPFRANTGDTVSVGDKFPGLIHQLRVSKSPRYDKDFKPPTTLEPDAETSALYRFDAGQGDKVADLSEHRRDGKIVAAVWVPAAAQKPVAPRTSPDPDRNAADWLVARGADFGYTDATGFHEFKAGKDTFAPTGQVRLITFKLPKGGLPADVDLVRFRGLPELTTVVLSDNAMSDDALTLLAYLPALQKLYLANTKVTDAGLQRLAPAAKLETLHLSGTAVTDTGLTHLAQVKGLRDVLLHETKVTGEGVKKLAAALPRCRIEYDGGTVGPK